MRHRTFLWTCLVAILMTCALAVPSIANEPPPVPEGGLKHIFHFPVCEDKETGEEGECRMSQDKDGNWFTTFWQEGQLMFIRKAVTGGYETIWVNDEYNSI